MKLSSLLNKDLILLNTLSGTKTSIIESLIDVLDRAGKLVNRDAVLQAVVERENSASTGLENGIAVPHAKSDAVNDIVGCLGVSRDGVDFDSLDGNPTNLFFFLVAPYSMSGPHVKTLAEIARISRIPGFINRVKEASSPEEIMEIILSVENGG
ncbi:MAG: PTS sugar transporter subunit IIA [Candidatus Theseobacter exili]|nr:PTS sugar transporter subunit IIA [Candidatus Theseobacter exili]